MAPEYDRKRRNEGDGLRSAKIINLPSSSISKTAAIEKFGELGIADVHQNRPNSSKCS